MSSTTVSGVQILGKVQGAQSEILTEPALRFIAALHRTFESTRQELLSARQATQRLLDAGQTDKVWTFPPETAAIREDPTWICAPPAPGLEDRRVEITGPTDRKMVINALNSGAKTFMADFEDSSSPTFQNMLNGQVNLRDAIRRQIDSNIGGKEYKLKPVGQTAVLIVRPRGWHLDEPRVLVDGRPVSGGIFDFGLFIFHNGHELVKRGHGPYFYLPKMEHYKEARLWNDIINFSQDYIRMPRGTVRGTVLIETLPAAFQMDEILFELRQHSSGLNCGRWDYIFSFIKKRRAQAETTILPDRSSVTMETPFMDAYVRLLIRTCHRRKVAAMGGMSAQIPIKGDEKANEAAMAKVRADKLREVKAGHDGTWIAHPLICKIAMDIFNEHMHGPNQYHIHASPSTIAPEAPVLPSDLLNHQVVGGTITAAGVKANVEAALAYCAAWVSGNGCVPINYLMEDAATAEIARLQLWQWVKGGAKLDTTDVITGSYIDKVISDVAPSVTKIVNGINQQHVDIAAAYLSTQVKREWASDFLTSDLMPYLEAQDGGKWVRAAL
ncbi:unnamed protein product [Rhizoctonia solani]|uniref:Malate synthase n=1 Tax=Rhizoctonia solani TaxID=456999 RepID=A0A8H3HMD3_9AGAM|nr:unnamed protein product [Rhizoctonia solani]